ncbi:MAG TPA: hypothetical protein VLH81_01375 [Desulfobacterales bacterium]|nr:hypothetical protein [Desulfobacterales bacterium]
MDDENEPWRDLSAHLRWRLWEDDFMDWTGWRYGQELPEAYRGVELNNLGMGNVGVETIQVEHVPISLRAEAEADALDINDQADATIP